MHINLAISLLCAVTRVTITSLKIIKKQMEFHLNWPIQTDSKTSGTQCDNLSMRNQIYNFIRSDGILTYFVSIESRSRKHHVLFFWQGDHLYFH